MANLQNPTKAIQAFCNECMGGNKYWVKDCRTEACPLWPFRMGKNPYRMGRQMTDEQKQAAVQRLCAARQRKFEEAQDG